MNGGDLGTLIHSEKELKLHTVVKIFLQISKGMSFLHSHVPQILHRDLKPQNILVLSSLLFSKCNNSLITVRSVFKHQIVRLWFVETSFKFHSNLTTWH